jgi:hypothetical protein
MAAFSAGMLSRFDEGLQLGGRAADFDPLNADSREMLGQVVFMGQLDEAAADPIAGMQMGIGEVVEPKPRNGNPLLRGYLIGESLDK